MVQRAAAINDIAGPRPAAGSYTDRRGLRRRAAAPAADKPRRTKAGPVPALDAPDARVTTHPAWPAFVSWVEREGDETHRVVRPDLLKCRRECWEFVWEVFLAGWTDGRVEIGRTF